MKSMICYLELYNIIKSGILIRYQVIHQIKTSWQISNYTTHNEDAMPRSVS